MRPSRGAPSAAVRNSRPHLLAGFTVGLVGLGQIGGSIVRRLSTYRPAIAVAGHDLRSDLAGPMRRYGAWCADLDGLVERSDLVVLAVPVPMIVRLLPAIAAASAGRPASRRLVVCDVGTVKDALVKAAARHRSSFDFVGLHPFAGTEGAGWTSAKSALFEGRTIVYCPSNSRPDAIARELVRLLGATPVPMAPRAHDALVAERIGLPHLLAFAAAGLALRRASRGALSAGSWRSLTRVAASDPAMVGGFLHANATLQRAALRSFRARLDRLDRALRDGDAARLDRILAVWQRGLRG
jgi:prephenate dehydrogenase